MTQKTTAYGFGKLKTAAAAATLSAAVLVTAQSAAAAPLTAHDEALIPVAAFTAAGDTEGLKKALSEALAAGVTVNELRDALEQLYAYCGFPRSLTALGTLVNLLKERREKGIADNEGRSSTPLPAGTDIRSLGTKVQTELVGRPVAGPVFTFSPNIDTYLKEHLFGAIFASDLLTYRQRELVTVSALAALPAAPQLRSHLNVSLNVGLTPEELQNFVRVLSADVGEEPAKLAQETLNTVLKARKTKP